VTKLPFKKVRLTIRTRFYILLLLLTILPFITYRFAVDLHKLLLENQAVIQKQTVINLAYILENRTDLWAKQVQSAHHTSQLEHLNLEKSVLWIVNEVGQVTYVIGNLHQNPSNFGGDIFAYIGYFLIKNVSYILPFTLPYPYPQSASPEETIITAAIAGQTYQQYRMDLDSPISLMSATPIKLNDKIIGAVILEKSMDSLLTDSLKKFYRLIGLGSIVFLFIFLGTVIYIVSLSRRIAKLDLDVRTAFDAQGKVSQNSFLSKTSKGYYEDELSDLRQHIFTMLNQLSSYERYLKQLPVTLRHELHNPMNRLSMSLSLLENDVQHKQINYSKHALEQLKQIISSLSEATSIEESLSMQTPEPFLIKEMLSHYAENIIELNSEHNIKADINLPSNLMLLGDGFMLEQLLDKLIDNAKDFDNKLEPIKLKAHLLSGNKMQLSVENSGEALSKGLELQIFDGMTSLRKVNSGEQSHLGLGLHIVKLISDFHNGEVFAHNIINSKKEITGVEVGVRLPVF